MSGPGRLAMTGSVFALPLAIIGAGMTFAGWVMTKWSTRPAHQLTQATAAGVAADRLPALS